MASSQSPSVQKALLQIPDAASLKTFLAEAKRVWLEQHPDGRKRRGRPSELSRVFQIIWKSEGPDLLGKPPTQGRLVRLVQDKMSPPALSEKAIRKYAKMWLLLFRTPASERSETEAEWLEKHCPMLAKAYNSLLESVFRYGVPSAVRRKGKRGTKITVSHKDLNILQQHVTALRAEFARLSIPRGSIAHELDFHFAIRPDVVSKIPFPE